MANAQIIPTAEPFFLPGGPVGCLLIHGFTGTPKEMRWLGQDLASRGYTVLAVRLNGHATRPEDMLRSRWRDWAASVEDGLNMLRSITERQFLIGLSMGGILSLYTAAHFAVDGVISISTPYALPPDPRLPFVRLVSILTPYVSKGAPDWRNAEAVGDHIDYPAYPTRSIAELADLLHEMRVNLPKITAPLLVVQSRQDHSIPADSLDRISSGVNSSLLKTMWVENSGHVIIREPDRFAVFQAAHEFIQEALKKSPIPRTEPACQFTVPAGRPIFSRGTKAGCLLLHGFSAMPAEMSYLAETLSQKGYAVLAQRLAGHGMDIDALRRTHWQDWLASVEDGLAILRGQTERVFLIGQSMGGLISLVSAAYMPVDGLVAISTPINDFPAAQARFLRWFGNLLPNSSQGQPDPDPRYTRRLQKDYPAYPAVPMRIGAEVASLLEAAHTALPQIKVPTLLIHSNTDRSVPFEAMEKIYLQLGSSPKNKLIVENSDHSIVYFDQREIAFKAILEFMEETLAA